MHSFSLMNYRALFALAAFCFIFSSCDDDSATSDPASPRLEVRLTDAPGDYEKVLIDVADVQIKFRDEEFVGLDTDYAGTYDLLELNNGLDALLAESDVPMGELEEVRLILGDGNYVHIDGNEIPLRTPSAQQSGLKVKITGDAVLEADRGYVLLLDFDAGRSVVRAGNSGNYNLKPVLRATLDAVDLPPAGGVIQGVLAPADGQYVQAINPGTDTLGTFVNDLGAFQFFGVTAGTYKVFIEAPTAASYPDSTILDVVVATDALVDLGTIVLD